MKKIFIIVFLVICICGCSKDKYIKNENSVPESSLNKEEVGVKNEGYIISNVAGKLKYESNKYINNEYDKEIPDTKDVISFEYLEDNYVNISFKGKKEKCENYHNFYKNKGYEIISSTEYDFTNGSDYELYSGIKNKLVFTLKCKKDKIILSLEEMR